MLTSHTDPESQLSQEFSIPLLNPEEEKDHKETGLTIQSISSEETKDDLKEEFPPASEEADNSSSHSNPEEEKDHPKKSIQFLHQDKALEFLEQVGISTNSLPNSEEFLSFLRQLLRIEKSPYRSHLRWAYIDSILERAFQIPFISLSAISLNPNIQNQSCTPRTGLQGRSIPLQNSVVRKEVLFVRNLLRGIEMTAFTAIHYFFYGLLGYHLYQLVSTGRTNFNELQQALFNVSYNGLVNLVQGLTQLPPDVLKGLLASTATPAVLLTANGLFQSDNFSEEAFNAQLKEAEPKESYSLFYTELWQWLPIFPVSNKLQDVERLLRWEGRLSSEQKLKGYELLERIALTGEKHIQRTAMECLAKLAHSFHVRELTLLKNEGFSQEALLDYLTIKQRALKTLQQLTQFKQEKALSSQAIRAIYANYLLWWLGLPSSRFNQAFFYGMKSIKITLEIILLINMIEIIEQALSCPKQPGFEFGEGFAPWAGDYTSECFAARLRLFRSEDLNENIDQFLNELHHYHLNELTTLDLSQKALNSEEVAKITTAIANEGAPITNLLLNNSGIISTFLPDKLFINLPQLQYLDLSSNNQITAISTQTFADLSQLKYLYLQGNLLTVISPEIFTPLIQLQKLVLGENRLTAISPEAFACLAQLQWLDLANNQLTAILPKVFTTLSQLRWLELGGNRLLTIAAEAFANLTSLRFLYLQGNYLSTIPAEAFTNLSQLQVLYLQSNQLTAISPEIFTPLSQLQKLVFGGNNPPIVIPPKAFVNLTQLKSLNLNGNYFTTISAELFINLTQLQMLDLGNNLLTAISPEVFNNLSQLKELDLSNNQFTTITPETFIYASQLTQLIFQDNSLTDIPAEAFANLPKLQLLSLNRNNFTDIPIKAFTYLTQLQELILSGNHFTIIPAEAFSNLTQLKLLDLSNNYFTIIPINAFTHLNQLRVLNLGTNLLTAVPPNIFLNLPQLWQLYLSNNYLTTIATEVFDNLTYLQWLDLESNYLTAISTETVANLSHLQWLFLQNNQLTAIPTGAFSNLLMLQVVDLRNNNLTAIPAETFVNLPQLQQLSLAPQKSKTFINSIAANAFINVPLDGSLDLSSQNLNDEAIYNLTQCLPKGITSLNLGGNDITQQGAEILADILPCTNITYIDLSNNPTNFTNFNRLTQENTLRQMCECQRCQGVWPDQTSCPVSKPADQSSYKQAKPWTLFGNIRDTVSNVFTKAFDSFCTMLGEHARDVVASCPSYFDPNAAEKMAENKPFKLYWNHSFFNHSKANLASNSTSTNYINPSLLGRP